EINLEGINKESILLSSVRRSFLPSVRRRSSFLSLILSYLPSVPFFHPSIRPFLPSFLRPSKGTTDERKERMDRWRRKDGRKNTEGRTVGKNDERKGRKDGRNE
ncbi:hypothetical protein CEXT_399621, partial [Caerostris extrusa]